MAKKKFTRVRWKVNSYKGMSFPYKVREVVEVVDWLADSWIEKGWVEKVEEILK